MQSSCTHINQNITAYPRSEKKIELIKDSQNIFFRTERGVGKQVRFVPNTGEGSGRQHNPSKQNCYINKYFLLLEDWQFNHKLCPPLSPTNKLPEKVSSQFDKI